MKTKAIVLLVGLAAAAAAAVVTVVPSLGATSAAETTVTAAAAGDFAKRASFAGLTLEGWTLGVGVIVSSDGSATGDLEVTVDAKAKGGQLRQIVLQGKAATGSVASGSARFSGTATLDTGGGALSTIPFTVGVTPSSFQLTLGSVALPAVKLAAGSVFIG